MMYGGFVGVVFSQTLHIISDAQILRLQFYQIFWITTIAESIPITIAFIVAIYRASWLTF